MSTIPSTDSSSTANESDSVEIATVTTTPSNIEIENEVVVIKQSFTLNTGVSPEMLLFMKENNVPLDAYDIKELSRFIRINPQKPITIEELALQLNVTPQSVPWLPSFYRLTRDTSIATAQAYKDAKIYGIDVSSGAVVKALDCKPGHNILDLCCAPGSKLCMMGDEVNHTGSLTGVDVSKERLSTCKTVLRKYSTQNIRLFHTDGCTFSIMAPGTTKDDLLPLNNNTGVDGDDEATTTAPPRKKQKKRRKGRENDAEDLYFCNSYPLRSANTSLYDRVLVDAECTLDASVRHILLYGKSSPHTTPQLSQLQRRLIYNGFRLLKPGGVLVYSTCSFCTAQNEDVVQSLLDACPSAKLLPIQFTHNNGEGTKDVPWDRGSLEHTVRFYPKSSGTSGMFIAKITKVVT